MREVKVKPCPFCGSKRVFSNSFPSGKGWIFCSNADCCTSGPYGVDEADAIRKWNKARRPAPAKRAKKIAA